MGLTADSSSHPMPHFSSVPAWKFSQTTSLTAASDFRISTPSGVRRSRQTDFLFRASLSQTSVSPASLGVPRRLAWSPTPGSSIL